MKSIRFVTSLLAALALTGCPEDKKCEDYCTGTGNACVDGVCKQVACSPACGAGTACQMGQCVAVEAVQCSPACGACQACDTSATTPACLDLCGATATCDAASGKCVAKVADVCGTGTKEVDGKCVPLACEPACGPGTACQMGQCEAVEAVKCATACGPCEACDTSGATPACVAFCGASAQCDAATGSCVPKVADLCGAGTKEVGGKCVPLACEPACGAGTACQMGQCVPVEAVKCATACAPCEACDTSGATPACVAFCGTNAACDVASGKCLPVVAPLCGAGTVEQNGKCVPVACSPACGPCESCDTSAATPTCIKLCGPNAICDATASQCVSVAEFHRTAPQLKGPFASGYKVTEACLGCHAKQAQDLMATSHWKWVGPTPQLVAADGSALNPGTIGKKNLVNNFCIAVPGNEKRCDQCHAGYGGDPDAAKPQKSARGYAKYDPTDATADSSIPLANRVDCLVCHSDPTAAYAKDPKNFGNPMATANLATAAKMVIKPTRSNCGACHMYAGGADNVKLMGSSLKNPSVAIDVHMGGGMGCNECHAAENHQVKGAGIHVPVSVERTGCADCHGGKPHEGKVASSGKTIDDHTAKIACQTCHIPTYSRGQHTKVDWDWSTAGNNTRGVAGVVTTKVNDLGVADPAGTAVTTYDFIKGDFKWMKNVRPAYAWYDGRMKHSTLEDRADFTALGLDPNDDAKRISLGEPVGAYNDVDAKIHPFKLMRGRQAVNVDGASGFVANLALMGPTALWGVLQAVGYTWTDQATMDGIWNTQINSGATKAGQLTGGATIAKFDGTKGWDWRYTKLYMDLNHEVAPKAQSLGANGACSDCHSAAPKLPLCELYKDSLAKPFGVVCP